MNDLKKIHQHRKDEHLSLALKYWKEEKNQTAGLKFSDLRLIPENLPELSLTDIDLSVELFKHQFESPFYIEAITGGTPRTNQVNENLAQLAKNQHLAMAVGSQSIAIKYPELAEGFKKVREIHRDGFLFANIGAGHDLLAAQKAVAMIEANALEIHINTAQELPMDEGDREFYWLENLDQIASKLDVPVIVKEVGFGISQSTYQKLSETAISGINVGGAGGTNFAWIERKRGKSGFNIDDFGLSTVESLLEAQFAGNQKALIATGGIQSADDILKSLMLGAQMTSSAGFILKNLMLNGLDETEAVLAKWREDLQKRMLLVGAKNSEELQEKELLFNANSMSYIKQRQ